MTDAAYSAMVCMQHQVCMQRTRHGRLGSPCNPGMYEQQVSVLPPSPQRSPWVWHPPVGQPDAAALLCTVFPTIRDMHIDQRITYCVHVVLYAPWPTPQVTYCGRQYRTRTVYNSLRPLWNEVFLLPENTSLLSRRCVTTNLYCVELMFEGYGCGI
jgi:hypothetical protein